MFFLLLFFFILRIFSGRFDTSGSMIARSVPEIEGGSPERDGEEGEEENGLVWSILVVG